MQRTSAEHSRIVGLQLSDPLRPLKQVKYPWTEEKNNDEQVTTIVNEHDTCQIQEIVRLLLSAGTNLTELDINEHTALDVAVKTKCEPVVTELLPLMQVEYATPDGNYSLSSIDPLRENWMALRTKHAADVVRSMGIDSEKASQYLDQAIHMGNEALLGALLQASADPTKPNADGLTTLHSISRWGLTSLMEKLGSRLICLGKVQCPCHTQL